MAAITTLGISLSAQQSTTTNQQKQSMQNMPGMQSGQMQHGQMHGKDMNTMMQWMNAAINLNLVATVMLGILPEPVLRALQDVR
jgi:hypothetical protein